VVAVLLVVVGLDNRPDHNLYLTTFWEISSAAAAKHVHTQAEHLQLSLQMFDIITFNNQQCLDNCSI